MKSHVGYVGRENWFQISDSKFSKKKKKNQKSKNRKGRCDDDDDDLLRLIIDALGQRETRKKEMY